MAQKSKGAPIFVLDFQISQHLNNVFLNICALFDLTDLLKLSLSKMAASAFYFLLTLQAVKYYT